jgi:hypothetical protein
MVLAVLVTIYFVRRFNLHSVCEKDLRTITEKGIDGSMDIFSKFFFTVFLLMPLIGFSMALTPAIQDKVIWLLKGWTGWVAVVPLSFVSPGGSGFSGIIMHMWYAARELRPLMLYFMTVTPLIAFTIFQIRSLGLGPEIAKKMYLLNWASAVWLLPMFLLYKRFIFKV